MGDMARRQAAHRGYQSIDHYVIVATPTPRHGDRHTVDQFIAPILLLLVPQQERIGGHSIGSAL